MKITEFNRLKFFRSYIGGSKKTEKEMFKIIQGVNEDNSDCDWFVFRRMLYISYYDKLNVIFSWKRLLNNIKFILLIPTIFIYTNIIILISLLLLSIILHLISIYLKKLEKNTLFNYNFCLDIILNEINKVTGLNLSIN